MGKLTRKKVNIDNSVIITQKDKPTDMTEIKDTHEGMVRSLLSGQWVSKEDYQNVPYAVMYSNIYDAMPQSDIGQFLNHRSRAALHVCVVFLKIKQTLKK